MKANISQESINLTYFPFGILETKVKVNMMAAYGWVDVRGTPEQIKRLSPRLPGESDPGVLA
jgi:hypothetical protein